MAPNINICVPPYRFSQLCTPHQTDGEMSRNTDPLMRPLYSGLFSSTATFDPVLYEVAVRILFFARVH